MNPIALVSLLINASLAALHVSRKKYGYATLHSLLAISSAIMVAA